MAVAWDSAGDVGSDTVVGSIATIDSLGRDRGQRRGDYQCV
jgi:hypothetical protein